MLFLTGYVDIWALMSSVGIVHISAYVVRAIFQSLPHLHPNVFCFVFLYKFSPNSLIGRIGKDRVPAKQSLLRLHMFTHVLHN